MLPVSPGELEWHLGHKCLPRFLPFHSAWRMLGWVLLKSAHRLELEFGHTTSGRGVNLSRLAPSYPCWPQVQQWQWMFVFISLKIVLV